MRFIAQRCFMGKYEIMGWIEGVDGNQAMRAAEKKFRHIARDGMALIPEASWTDAMRAEADAAEARLSADG